METLEIIEGKIGKIDTKLIKALSRLSEISRITALGLTHKIVECISKENNLKYLLLLAEILTLEIQIRNQIIKYKQLQK